MERPGFGPSAPGKGERVRQERTALTGNGSGMANPTRSKAE